MPIRFSPLIRWALLVVLPLAAACARESGPSLAAPEALELARAHKLTIVDIRRPEEWRQTGVAEGAARIDMRHPQFADALLAQVGGDRNAPIALICRTGNRTSQMQAVLRDQGFTKVYHIGEGMAGSAAGPGWIRRGLPVEPCVRC
jgi:rhodanese-related sulfurtransferase